MDNMAKLIFFTHIIHNVDIPIYGCLCEFLCMYMYKHSSVPVWVLVFVLICVLIQNNKQYEEAIYLKVNKEEGMEKIWKDGR